MCQYHLSLVEKPSLHCHKADPDTILVYTYNALYVSVSSFLCSTCMTVKTKMIENGGAHDLYKGIFGNVTYGTCPLHEYPCVFLVYLWIDKAASVIDRAFGLHGFYLHFTPHLGFLFPTNQKLPTEYSAHGSNGCLVYSQMTFFSCPKTLKQATSIYGKLLLCTSVVFIASTAD